MSHYNRLREYDDGPDDTHEECLSEDDLEEARTDGVNTGLATMAERIDALIPSVEGIEGLQDIATLKLLLCNVRNTIDEVI